jgi:hypothetical protein
VATSITSFVGYTAQGAVNKPAHLVSFADFERGFGGLSVDIPVSYAIRDSFRSCRIKSGAATECRYE